MRCFQCDLDIAHVCYAGRPNARWGLHDDAIAALEAAQHYLRTGEPPKVSIVKTTETSKSHERIPAGWTLEPATGWSEIFVLTATDHLGCTTIDFQRRGFRGGAFVISGPFVGEKLTRRGYTRKKYGGRGWRQALVDDAVTWLEGTRRS